MSSPMFKSLLAGVCFLGAVLLGLPLMLTSELHTHLGKTFDFGSLYGMSASALQQVPAIQTMVQQGLKPYCTGFGLVLLLVAIALVVLDGEDKIATLRGTDSE
ncbi:MAG: hypothetical protein U0003_03145 [Vampirovibrionales bacterium]